MFAFLKKMIYNVKQLKIIFRKCPTLNDEKNEIVQQEIAPNEIAVSDVTAPQPVENKKNKAAAFFKRSAFFLVFGNRIKLRNKTAYITYMSILVALALIISFIKYDIGPMKVSFNYIPCFIAGIFFGPLFAVCVGLVIPIGQFLSLGYWPWALNMVGFALMGFIMSITVQGIKTKKIGLAVKIILGAVTVCFAVTYGVNTVAYMIEPIGNSYYGWSYFRILFYSVPPRALFQPIVLAINTVITVLLAKGLDIALFKNTQNAQNAQKERS